MMASDGLACTHLPSFPSDLVPLTGCTKFCVFVTVL